MKSYTNYPIIELGDIPNQPAPMREVEVVAYDTDGYCAVWVKGVSGLKQIKAEDLYIKPGGKTIDCSKLEQIGSMPEWLKLFDLGYIEKIPVGC